MPKQASVLVKSRIILTNMRSKYPVKLCSVECIEP